MLGNWKRGIAFPNEMPKDERRRITGGENLYFQTCVTCHGPEGKGLNVPGTDQLLAPSLVDSARVKGKPSQLIPIFLHGLTGPIDGKTYQAGFMAPAAAFGITRDDRLAELISYIRFVHGERASSVSKEEVTKVRKQHGDREAAWTDLELREL